MVSEPRDDEERLERIVGGAAETVLEATDEEIEAEARAEGLDPAEVAEGVQGVLLGAVERFRGKQRLTHSRADYEARVAAMQGHEPDLPEEPMDRRQLLALAFRARPQAAGMLTLQFRDLESLPDEDVTSCLRQLAELGVLDDLPDDRSRR